MDCRTTSTTRRRWRYAAAFTLVETWVALGIVSVLFTAMASFMMYTGKSFAGLSNYVDLEAGSQQALDTMTKDIRQTQCLKSISQNQLVFLDYDNLPLTFTYSPEQRTLVRLKGNIAKTLLTECDFLSFSNYQRNPIGGKFEEYPVSISPTLTKLVSVTWICSRKIIGSKMNTESVQTAKIVIRKE